MSVGPVAPSCCSHGLEASVLFHGRHWLRWRALAEGGQIHAPVYKSWYVKVLKRADKQFAVVEPSCTQCKRFLDNKTDMIEHIIELRNAKMNEMLAATQQEDPGEDIDPLRDADEDADADANEKQTKQQKLAEVVE